MGLKGFKGTVANILNEVSRNYFSFLKVSHKPELLLIFWNTAGLD